jgi:predicted DNA-binding transcriptional regulator AlpA
MPVSGSHSLVIPGVTGCFPQAEMTMSPNEYVDTRKLAEITGISASTWNKRRLTGDTPPFTKIGKSVRYHVPTVRAWLANLQRRSTSDSAAAAA